ncbi:hypothetical protein lerEdw1_009038 [Lerista edwardsae]|nr:hypothetical protein lerEdw1_009038 [Lerista edwardsae]
MSWTSYEAGIETTHVLNLSDVCIYVLCLEGVYQSRSNSYNSCRLLYFYISTGCAVKQRPYMVVEKGKSETLTCSQLKTRHDYMYWYKQGREKDTQLQLVVYSLEGSGGKVEKDFQGRFASNGTQNYALSLQLKSAQLEDSGTYFCAKQDYTVRQLLRKPNTNLFTGKCKRIREQIFQAQVQPNACSCPEAEDPSGSPFPGPEMNMGHDA